jgi:hypothetical protein
MKKAMLFAGAAALGAAAMGRGRRAATPIATIYDPASHRVAFAYSDGDVAFGTGSPKKWIPKGRVIAKDSARQQKLMVGWVYRNEDPRRKQKGRRASFKYKIFEGYDHYKGRPLYQVTGVNNDYVGEWHTLKKDAQAELRGLTKTGHSARGRRAAERRRTYKTLAGLQRAMGDRVHVSLDEINRQRAYFRGKGWRPIRYTLTDEDISEIATKLGGHERTQNAVANGLRYGRMDDLPYSTLQRIVWNPSRGWSYVAGQDYRAETARIRNILKK